MRRARNARRALYAVMSLIALTAITTLVWGFFFLRGVQRTMQQAVAADPKVAQALTEAKSEEPFTILIMGVDGRPSEGAQRTDTMIVARVDPASKRVWMVSIPRDTKVKIPDHGTGKANKAYFAGGPALAIRTVEGLLDVPINHYMVIGLNGFQKIVDAMGGVYIDVDVAIDDYKAAAASPGHRARRIEPGYQLLDGEHALTYVRSRDFPDADFARMKHQQTFFKALAQQSMRWGNVFRLPGMVKQFSRYTSTDMDITELIDVVRALRGISDMDVQTATLPGEWKSPYIVANENEKTRLSEALRSGGDIETTATVEPAVVPASVSVAVRNGAGVAGVAADAAGRLRQAGFAVGPVGNANQFVYDATLIVYTSDAAAATVVADALGRGKLVESRGMYSFDTDVLVVVGKDWENPL